MGDRRSRVETSFPDNGCDREKEEGDVVHCLATFRAGQPIESRELHDALRATWHLDVVSRDSIQGLAAC